MNIQGAGLDLIRNPDKLYDWMGLKQSPGKVETTQTTKAPFAQKPKKEKDPFLEGFYSVADKPKEERRSYISPFAKSRAILDSISQTKPAKRVVGEEEDDFLKGFYSVADRPKEETPISAQPPTVQKNTQTAYKPGDWVRRTMTNPTLWDAKNTDLSPQKVNYASQTNTSATPYQNTRTGESRDKYDSRIRNQYAARRQAEEDARYADYDVEAAQSRLDDYSAWTDKLIESRKNGNGFDGDYDVVAERNALEAEIKRAKAAQARNRARKYAAIPDPGVVLGDGGIYISALEHPEYLQYITPEETRKYAYLKVTEGVESANEYLNYLESQLTARKGAETGRNVVDGGALLQIPYRAFAGLESYGRNISQLMTEEAVPLSATAYANQYIRENTDGVGRFAGDLSYGLGNVAPSVAAGMLNPWLGKASFAASAYGGAYNNALLEGKETKDARTYAALSTASEVAMQHLLGGISALGGKTSLVNLSENLINKIGNVNLRLTAQLGNRMLGEGAEEGLQTYMEAALRNVLFDEDYNLRDVSEEALYNSMLGAVTAFVTESPACEKMTQTSPNIEDKHGFNRQTQNIGAFSQLQEYISKKHIRNIANEYDVEMKGITINIDKNPELLKVPFTGRADYENVGQITFFPNAFKNKEELIRTIYHEKCHVQQYREFGVEYVLNNRKRFELEAYEKEEAFIQILKERGVL